MRLPLVGQQYQARSLASAAQTCINVYAEPVEDPNEKAKGYGALYGCPNKHAIKTLTTVDAGATPLRGVWSQNGRLWVAAGTKYFELDSSYALVGSVRTIADDAAHSPVTFFYNGQQLFIVSAGMAYCDPLTGVGPVAITMPAFTGTATGLGLFADWVSGDFFDPGMAGQNFTIGVTTKVVATVVSPTTITVTVSWGGAPVSGAYTCTPTMPISAGAYLDGYFIAVRSNSRQFNISTLLNGLGDANDGVWDPLMYAQKESYPDYIQSVLVSGEQLYIFGANSFEVWQDVGALDFPFQRIDGATGKYGSCSIYAPIAIGGKVFFLGGDSTGQVSAYLMNGFTPQRISTHAEETAWNTGGLGSSFISYGYSEEGHQFWVLNPGTGAQSWCYDLTTGLWHIRAKYTVGNVFANPYGPSFHTFVTNSPSSANNWGPGGKHLVGSIITAEVAKLYESSINFYDDDGADAAWQRALPYFWNDGKRFYDGRMDLEIQTGMVASGAAPVVTRDYSDDRGNTFINAETASLGVHNDYSLVVDWPLAGLSTGRVYRFTGIGQSKVAVMAVNVDRWIGQT